MTEYGYQAEQQIVTNIDEIFVEIIIVNEKKV